MNKRFLVGLGLLLAMAAVPVVSAPAFADQVSDRAAELAAIPGKIKDGDLYARIANLEALLGANDSATAQIALKVAFAAPEPEIQAVALRYWFKKNQTFLVKRIIPEAALAANQKVVDRRKFSTDPGGNVALYVAAQATTRVQLSEYVEEAGTGRVRVATGDGVRPFQIQDNTITFGLAQQLGIDPSYECLYGPFHLDGTTLKGPFTCNFPQPPGSTAEITLY